MDNNIYFAFLLTLFAGLSTGIGSLLAMFTKRTNTKFLSVSLGFSAGVMIYVSFVEIFPKAQEALTNDLGEPLGNWITVISFFGGIALIALIDRLIPSPENPHELSSIEEIEDVKSQLSQGDEWGKEVKKREGEEEVDQRLLRMGVFTALALAIHNFPEGIATFLSAYQDPALGVAIAIAIALHNIPEGISVFVPIFYATGSRKKAFNLSFLSGLAEPVGAIVGYLILRPFLSGTLFGILFAGVAGIMVFISLDELLPSAREYGETHLSIYGLFAGMVAMALSLLLLM